MTTENPKPSALASATSTERIGEMDVLRGFALLGVLVSNFVWFAFGWNTSTEVQEAGFLEIEANRLTLFFVSWLIDDKANTLFAFLFGVGFWVQMQRLQARGGPFEKIYLRRLAILFMIGVANLLLVWPWDILQQYAYVGALLLLLRKLSARSMLLLAVPLTLLSRPLIVWLTEMIGWRGAAHEIVFSETARIQRQNVFADGTYFEWVQESIKLTTYDYLANGLIIAWTFYVLGRFLLGAYVARKGWIQRAGVLLPVIRRILFWVLPLGLAIEGWLAAVSWDYMRGPDWLGHILHPIGTFILSIGYGAGIIVLLHSIRWKKLALAFAPVGRMALTNYLMQGVFIGLILYGFHGGLALAGTVQPWQVLTLSVIFYFAQLMVSQWWLSHHRFGPMEYLWRWGTYGHRP